MQKQGMNADIMKDTGRERIIWGWGLERLPYWEWSVFPIPVSYTHLKMFAKIGSGLNRNAKKYRKKAVDDGSTALIFTYKLITKNSDIY